MLAALLIRIRVVRNSRDPAAMEPLLEDMREQVSHALEGIAASPAACARPRSTSWGWCRRSRRSARSLEEIGGVAVSVRAEDVAGDLPPEAELATYRIVQEALSNVMRHARATRADVRIAHEGERLVVAVEDDGRGFDPAHAMSTDGAASCRIPASARERARCIR